MPEAVSNIDADADLDHVMRLVQARIPEIGTRFASRHSVDHSRGHYAYTDRLTGPTVSRPRHNFLAPGVPRSIGASASPSRQTVSGMRIPLLNAGLPEATR